MSQPHYIANSIPSSAGERRDAHYVAQTLAGDTKSFRVLVERYSGLVYSVIYRMTQNTELADDITQEAFVKAYQKLKTFDSERAFRPWLLRIASNAALSELRKRSRVVSLDAITEKSSGVEGLEEAGAFQAPRLALDDSVALKLTSEQVFRAIELLEPNYRVVLLLRYREDFSYEEVSTAMGVPVNTVRTWIRRGREKLRQTVIGEIVS